MPRGTLPSLEGGGSQPAGATMQKGARAKASQGSITTDSDTSKDGGHSSSSQVRSTPIFLVGGDTSVYCASLLARSLWRPAHISPTAPGAEAGSDLVQQRSLSLRAAYAFWQQLREEQQDEERKESPMLSLLLAWGAQCALFLR